MGTPSLLMMATNLARSDSPEPPAMKEGIMSGQTLPTMVSGGSRPLRQGGRALESTGWRGGLASCLVPWVFAKPTLLSSKPTSARRPRPIPQLG